VYAPREIVWGAGMLPVAIWGGGDRVEIIKGDAFYQSYICHLPRSVIELGQSGKLDFLSAMLFPSTCDVIRNLSGIWRMLHPEVYVRYLDLPQVLDASTGGAFWRAEMEILSRELGERAGMAPDAARLREAIGLYNEVRHVLRELYRVRRERPWALPTSELYVLIRAGEVVPPQVFLDKARAYLATVEASDARPKDRARVVVVGAFCEQPPLGLIKTIERAGCYIVDDDFVLGNRFLTADVAIDGDPWQALSDAFITSAVKSSVLYEDDPGGKRALIAAQVEASKAEGVIFAAPSFCDPALLDRVMLRAGATAHQIPQISFRYAENTGQFQPFREQAGTFADSLKLWGGAA